MAKKKKVKWKRTKDGIVFLEKQSLAQRFSRLGFMQVSIGTFFAALVFLLIGLIISVAMNGSAPLMISVLWVASFGLALIGIGVTWYGHFQVEAESKLRWRYGIITNGIVLVILIVIYILGLFFG